MCRIRKLGYPVRRDKDDFFRRYKVIEPLSSDLDALLAAITKSGKIADGEFAMGKSKVFLKNKASQGLEELREEAFIVQAIKVQATARKYIMMKKFKSWHATVEALKVSEFIQLLQKRMSSMVTE